MSRLCLSCGLCCNGVIFSSVPVAAHDDLAPLEGGGITVSIIDGKHRFAQPCVAHDGRQCRVYASRPTACRQYRCDLLERFEKGGVELGEALRLIGEAVRLNGELAQALREIEPRPDGQPSRASLITQFSARLEETLEAETRQKVGAIVVHLLALDEFIRRNFGDSVLEWSKP